MINRIEPAAPAAAYVSYELKRPATAEFWRRATCAEVGCGHHLHGWRISVDMDTELGQAQARYIRTESGRAFTQTVSAGGLVEFTFEAGQSCFEQHVLPARDPIYLVRGGDWRGNPTGERHVHTSGEDFVDEWQNHADRLNTLRVREGVPEMLATDINTAYAQDM